MLVLRELQRRFLQSLVTPHAETERVGFDPGVEALVVVRDPLDARARIDIYARMYCARLIDALAKDFPRVRTELGESGFDRVAHDYFNVHPSSHPSLRFVGRRFASFLRTREEEAGRSSYLPDLAALEWARLDVFDATDARPLASDVLRATPPEAWGDLRLSFVPAMRMLVCAWPVHAIWAQSVSGGPWTAVPTTLRVWRQGFTVHQASVDEVELRAIRAVGNGTTFGSLCAVLADGVEEEVAAATAGALLLRWLEDNVLRADEPDRGR